MFFFFSFLLSLLLLGHPTGWAGLFSSFSLFLLFSLFSFLPSLFLGHPTGSGGSYPAAFALSPLSLGHPTGWADPLLFILHSPLSLGCLGLVLLLLPSLLFPLGHPTGPAGLFFFLGTPYGLPGFFLLFSYHLVFPQNALRVACISYFSIYYINLDPMLTLQTLTLY